jgi:hypothetical protein
VLGGAELWCSCLEHCGTQESGGKFRHRRARGGDGSTAHQPVACKVQSAILLVTPLEMMQAAAIPVKMARPAMIVAALPAQQVLAVQVALQGGHFT